MPHSLVSIVFTGMDTRFRLANRRKESSISSVSEQVQSTMVLSEGLVDECVPEVILSDLSGF